MPGKLFLLDKIRADTSNEVSALLVTFAFEILLSGKTQKAIKILPEAQ
jgi:hypothetical protein